MTRLRAFVVEDSPLILENLIGVLEEDAGVEVVASAADEKGALDWMNSRTDGCDFVIIDIFLRQGSGLGVLKGMAGFAPPPERVVFSNYATDDMKNQCFALGAEAVFDKSCEIEELLHWVSTRAPARSSAAR